LRSHRPRSRPRARPLRRSGVQVLIRRRQRARPFAPTRAAGNGSLVVACWCSSTLDVAAGSQTPRVPAFGYSEDIMSGTHAAGILRQSKAHVQKRGPPSFLSSLAEGRRSWELRKRAPPSSVQPAALPGEAAVRGAGSGVRPSVAPPATSRRRGEVRSALPLCRGVAGFQELACRRLHDRLLLDLSEPGPGLRELLGPNRLTRTSTRTRTRTRTQKDRSRGPLLRRMLQLPPPSSSSPYLHLMVPVGAEGPRDTRRSLLPPASRHTRPPTGSPRRRRGWRFTLFPGGGLAFCDLDPRGARNPTRVRRLVRGKIQNLLGASI
jgi:hypothetical protein